MIAGIIIWRFASLICLIKRQHNPIELGGEKFCRRCGRFCGNPLRVKSGLEAMVTAAEMNEMMRKDLLK